MCSTGVVQQLLGVCGCAREVQTFRSEGSTHCVLGGVCRFFDSVVTLTSVHAGLPYMGMSARAHSAVPAPSPTLLRHRCTLLSASQIRALS